MSVRQYDDGLEKSCDRVVETGASRVEIPAQVAAHLDDWFGTDRRLAIEALLRHPDEIMTPDALSAMKSCALSFSRTLLQRMADERWDFRRRTLEIDADGVGFAVYELRAAGHYFSAIIRANWDGEEKASRRMDRTADFIASLVTGYAEDELVTRELAAMGVPHWGGRTDSRSFGFTAANRSKRHFDQAVEALTAGRHPILVSSCRGATSSATPATMATVARARRAGSGFLATIRFRFRIISISSCSTCGVKSASISSRRLPPSDPP